MSQPQRVEVAGAQPYPVLIGDDVLPLLPGLLSGASRVAVLHTAALSDVAEGLLGLLRRQRPDLLAVLALPIPDAEAGKSLNVAQQCWDALGAAGFTRNDAIVGVGGGALTDVAGFTAACWLRGVRWIAVPTSTIGMVDAAVGGKTGVNTSAGKNLVGAFHPPTAVLCELSTLETLPESQLRSGMAEIVKCGFISDPVILELIEADPAASLQVGSPVLAELIVRSVRVKADVVGVDLRESGLREILNYGHTLAHAIELVEGYRWSHGDAVAVGLVFAANVAAELGRLEPATVERHAQILDRLGLPTSYPADAWPRLDAAMRLDKKARGDQRRLVLLDSIAHPVVVAVQAEVLAGAYQRIASDWGSTKVVLEGGS